MPLKNNNEDYQQGYEDALQYSAKTNISLNEVLNTFDKFFDKINNLKKILRDIKNICENNVSAKNDRIVKRILSIVSEELEKENYHGKKDEVSEYVTLK